MKLSDFGLAKRVPLDQSSFAHTTTTGTVGWRAPECMRSRQEGLDESDSSVWEVVSDGPEIAKGAISTSVRLTSAVDVWSLGLLAYWVLTEGRHPLYGEALAFPSCYRYHATETISIALLGM